MKRRNFMGAAAGLAAAGSVAAAEDTAAGEAAIRRTVLDYIEGWYLGDASRMERSLHPELAKRILARAPDGKRRLQQMGAMALTQQTRARPRRGETGERREVRILDVFQGTASVRLDASDWIDYMHLVEVEPGQWQIINVLWDLRQ